MPVGGGRSGGAVTGGGGSGTRGGTVWPPPDTAVPPKPSGGSGGSTITPGYISPEASAAHDKKQAGAFTAANGGVSWDDLMAQDAASLKVSDAAIWAPKPLGPEAGLDFTTPGDEQQFYADNKSRYTDPTRTDTFFENNLSQYQNHSPVSNRAEEAYQSFNGSVPQNMDPFYDNARRQAMEQIDAAGAARGTYASSTSMDQINEANVNIGAQQARDEAQYGLDRASMMGQLGSGADVSSGRASTDNLSWLNSGSNAATAADVSNLSFLTAGQRAAGGSEAAKRTRGQDFFNNTLAIGDRTSGIINDAGNNIIDTESGSFDVEEALRLGIVTEAQAEEARKGTASKETLNTIATAVAAYKSGKK